MPCLLGAASSLVRKWGRAWLLPQFPQKQVLLSRHADILSHQHCVTPMTVAGLASWAHIYRRPQKPFAGGSCRPSLIIVQSKKSSRALSFDSVLYRNVWIHKGNIPLEDQGEVKGFIPASCLIPSGSMPGLNLGSHECLLFEFPRARWMKTSRKYWSKFLPCVKTSPRRSRVDSLAAHCSLLSIFELDPELLATTAIVLIRGMHRDLVQLLPFPKASFQGLVPGETVLLRTA